MSEIESKTLSSGFPYVLFRDKFVLCGQVRTKEELKELREEGFDLLINLRNKEELTPFDMECACQDCHCSYAHIPIRFSGEIKKEAVSKVSSLISKEKRKVILHCASGARSTLSLLGHLHLYREFKKRGSRNFRRRDGFSKQGSSFCIPKFNV